MTTATLEAPALESPPQTKKLSLAESLRRAADWLDQHPGLAERVADIHPKPELAIHFSRLDDIRAALKGHEVREFSTGFYVHYEADMGGWRVTALGAEAPRTPERTITL